MRFSYNKLWKILIDKNMKKKDLLFLTKIGSSTIAKMRKNRPINLTVLGRICNVLDVNIGDVVEIIF